MNEAQKEWDEYRQEIPRELVHWGHLREHGGQDPFYPDGTNMNLTRNHVIHAKRRLRELAAEHGWNLPEEYYFQTPPEVDDNYMANLDQKKRVERLSISYKLTTKKPEQYDERQISLI